jgi:glutathione reductase (NADPH)
LDAHTVVVGDVAFAAPHVLVATGGRPMLPDVPGAEHGITSDGFFELERLPKRVAVVGAGYIAVELAGILCALGSDVALFMRYRHPLREFDSSLGIALAEQMSEAGIEIVRECNVTKLEKRGTELELYFREVPPQGPFDCVLWAIGRAPNTTGFGLETTGVRTSETGHVVVDAFQSTNVEGIYAVGDVTGSLELTPVAIAAGRKLADRVFGGDETARIDYDGVPTVVFSHPPIGTVGLSETAARAKYGATVKVYEHRFTNLYYGVMARKARTTVRLVVVGPEERIVGIHVIGMGADELLQGFAVALRMGATKADLDRTIAIHPTAAEELVTIK